MKYSYVLVPDMYAGKKNRCTLYKIPHSPNKRVKIIGREITRRIGLRLIEQDLKE